MTRLDAARAAIRTALVVYRNRDHDALSVTVAALDWEPWPPLEQQPGAVAQLEALYAAPAYGEQSWTSEPSDVLDWTDADTAAYWRMIEHARLDQAAADEYEATRLDLDADEPTGDDPADH